MERRTVLTIDGQKELRGLTAELEEMRMSWAHDFPLSIQLLGLALPELQRIGIEIIRVAEEPDND